jgi:hypothetical protein
MNYPRTFSAFVPAMGNNNHMVHPWVQSQRTAQAEEQYLPTTIPSYVSNIKLPATSYTQDRVVNYNHESKVCGQQTIVGIINGSCQLTVPLELLKQQSTLEAPPTVELREIVFLGPHQSSIDFFLNSRDVLIKRAIYVLENLQSLKKITFSLDFTDLAEILKTLGKISGMQEIELTLPTASKLKLNSMDMVKIQDAFVAGLKHFRHLNRLTMPMELVTAFLLSHLAALPILESLSVKYSPPPRSPSYQQQFPAWSSYRVPAECPGYIFIAHLNFDPREHFGQLSRLDLGAPLSETSYTTLRILFPKTYIC